LRVDVNITDKFSAWVLGAYQSDFDSNSFYTGESNWFGQWQGDWAVWGSVAAKISDKAVINGQAAYEDEGTYALALNVAYELVPGFKITPDRVARARSCG
jgi:Porin subfamily